MGQRTKFCEYRKHDVESVKPIKVHDDGVNPVTRAYYCDECIRELQNEWLEGMNDIATQEDYHQLWNV